MEMEFFVPPDEAAAVVRVLAAGAPGLVHRGSASAPTTCGCARTTPTSSRTTRRPPATSSTCTRSAGRSSRAIANRGDFDLTPARASTRGEKLEYFDPQTGERYVPHVIEPAAGVGRADARVPVRRLRRGRDRRRDAHRAAAAPARSRRSRSPCCRCCARTATRSTRARSTRRCAGGMQRRVRRGRRDRQALPPPGRDRHAVRGDDRPPDARGPHRHAARPRLARPGAHRDRRARRTSSTRRLAAPWRSPKLA